MRDAMLTKVRLKAGLPATALFIVFSTPAHARPGVISAETYACVSWAAAHEYTLQSLRPKGGQINSNCPIRISKGTPVDVTSEDDEGYAVVTQGGKTWWVDGDRVK